MNYQVAQYRNGLFEAIMSGLGRHRGTLNSTHSRSCAYLHAKDLASEPWRKHAGLSYKVLRTNIDPV